jgi:hypothetical protein
MGEIAMTDDTRESTDQATFFRDGSQEVIAYAFEAYSDYTGEWNLRVEFGDPRENWPGDHIRCVRELVEK